MMQYKVKKVFQTVMYITKITIVSFFGNRNHNIVFVSCWSDPGIGNGGQIFVIM